MAVAFALVPPIHPSSSSKWHMFRRRWFLMRLNGSQALIAALPILIPLALMVFFPWTCAVVFVAVILGVMRASRLKQRGGLRFGLPQTPSWNLTGAPSELHAERQRQEKSKSGFVGGVAIALLLAVLMDWSRLQSDMSTVPTTSAGHQRNEELPPAAPVAQSSGTSRPALQPLAEPFIIHPFGRLATAKEPIFPDVERRLAEPPFRSRRVESPDRSDPDLGWGRFACKSPRCFRRHPSGYWVHPLTARKPS